MFWTANCGHKWQATIASRSNGVGCPICARKSNGIKITQTIKQKNGSLAATNPSLSKEWHPSRNGSLTPSDLTANSHLKVWWLGLCQHEWQATVKNRNNGSACPICSTKIIVPGINDLKTTNPQLAKEWNEKRNELSINMISAGSSKKVWWECALGHEWQASPKSRSRGDNCPICSGHTVLPGFNDLKTCCPDLIKEWHPTLNKELKPEDITSNSHMKVWWQCDGGHIWQASPNHRAKGRNCPYCCANPQVLPGVNDLMTINPKLAEEWDFNKNGVLTPQSVTAKSSKYVWWKCVLGHSWKTSVQHRSDGSGCPYCSSGRQTSFPEQAIYFYVYQNYPDAINGYTEFFNNHGMELDIYIPSLKIGIEYDGIAFHKTNEVKEREKKKYQKCQSLGVKLIRIREDKFNINSDTCDGLIVLENNLEDSIKHLSQYGICITDVNIERDRNLIDSRYHNAFRNNSLQSKYPQIASEWNFSKNGLLTPDMFAAKSGRKVWWKCTLGHEWEAVISERVRGAHCPYCTNNKILKGYNDFASLRSDLLLEWDYEKNTNVDPYSITPGSGKKVWWKCKQGHSWQAVVNSRNQGHGCPYCRKHKFNNT